MAKIKKSSKKEIKPKKRKKVPEGRGIIHANFSFNNTKLDLAKENGDVLTWVSGGSVELGSNKKVTGTRKGTLVMAEKTVEELIKRTKEFKVSNIKLVVSGIGAGREPVIKKVMEEKWKQVRKKLNLNYNQHKNKPKNNI